MIIAGAGPSTSQNRPLRVKLSMVLHRLEAEVGWGGFCLRAPSPHSKAHPLKMRHVFKGPRLSLQVIEQYSLQAVSLQNESVAYSLIEENSNGVVMKERKTD